MVFVHIARRIPPRFFTNNKEMTMISDPTLFLRRIMERTLAKSPHLGSTLMGQDNNAAEDLLVEVLSDRVAEMFEMDDSSKSVREEESSESELDEGSNINCSPTMLAHYNWLVKKNHVLAAALGACDCWGEIANCPSCHEWGKPGWRLPNKRLFAYFVRPAIKAVNWLRASKIGEGMKVRK
jgi:hypothetical protein